MKIESSSVDMQAFTSNVFKHETSLNTSTWQQEIENIENAKIPQKPVRTTILLDLTGIQVVFHDEKELSEADRLKKEIIEMLLERLTGNKKEVKLHPKENNNQVSQTSPTNPYENPQRRINWGFAIQTKETYYQKSSIDFSTKAQIKTANGKEFNIDLDLSFSKEFYEEHKSQLIIGSSNFIDPLVINYKDNINGFDNISKLRFAFDLNDDNDIERIPLLKDGAGFLALDKNSNGVIDNGSELFGTKSGDGFADLKKYDKDGNDWIDENDEIFNNLKIWEKNDKGDDKLITLAQAGIGAIYLASVDSKFDYHESVDSKIAHLKQSSFYLKENGKAGLVTGLDFIV